MKSFVKWATLACLSLVLAVSACQLEESGEILAQPQQAYNENSSAGPEAPGEVIFVEMIIPEDLQSAFEEGEAETKEITVLNEAGEEVHGLVRITFPFPEDDGGLVRIELSANVLEAGGLDPEFFVNLPLEDTIKNCKDIENRHERRLCHWNNIFRVADIFWPF